VSRSRRTVKPIGRLAVAAAMAGLLPAVAACEAGNNAPTMEFHQQSAGVDTKVQGIEIRNAFVLGAANGLSIAAGRSAGLFLALYNDGDGTDQLLSATSSAAKSVTLPAGGIKLGSAQAVYLTGPKPEIILTGLTHALAGGDTISVTLDFANAGKITMTLPVLARVDDYGTFLQPPSPSPAPSSPSPSSSASGKSGTPTGNSGATPSATPSADTSAGD